MRAVPPLAKTPVDPSAEADSGTVEVLAPEDLTEREMIGPAWAAGLGRPDLPPPSVPELVRSRKETLVSPIPALLAAQMAELDDSFGSAPPRSVSRPQEATSAIDLFDEEAPPPSSVGSFAEEDDYVVELVSSLKSDR